MPQAQTYQSEFTGQEMDARFAAVAQLTAALEALTAVVAQKYVKPASGIPSTDMDADVQAALAKANSAVQSLADYYTKSEVDQLLAAINGMEYVDVAALPTASASTLGKIYLVGPDASGYYAYYYTSYDGSAYSWVGPLGTTQISLAGYATKEELSQLDQEVVDLEVDVQGSPQAYSVIWGKPGYYLSLAGVPTPSSSWSISSPFILKKGRTIACSTQGSGACVIASTTDEVTYTPLVLIPSGTSGTNTFNYTAQEDISIVVCAKTGLSGVAIQISAVGLNAQVENLSKVYNKKTAILGWVYGYYLYTNKSIGTAYDTTPHAENHSRYVIVPISAGKKYIVNGRGGSSPRLWCFADANNLILSVSGAGISSADDALVLTPPENATQLIINNLSGYTEDCYELGLGDIEKINDSIAAINTVLDTEVFTNTITENGHALSSGRNIIKRLSLVAGMTYRVIVSVSGAQSRAGALYTGWYNGSTSNEITTPSSAHPSIPADTSHIEFYYTPEADYPDGIFGISNYSYDAGNIQSVDVQITNMSLNERVGILEDAMSGISGVSIFSFNPDVEVRQKMEHITRATRLSDGVVPNSLVSFLHFSDLHGQQENLERIIAFSEKYDSFITDILSSGDQIYNDITNSFDFWNAAGAEKVLLAIGNHDAWKTNVGPNEDPASASDCYTKYFGNISQWGVTSPGNGLCYYYKDYNTGGSYPVRLIVIDCMHIDSAQTAWFTSLLADAKTNGYTVIVMSHYSPSVMNKVTFDNDSTFTCIEGSRTNTNYATVEPFELLVKDFIDGGGKFACWLTGHMHWDFFGLSEHGQPIVCVECATTLRTDRYDARVIGTKTQDSFNIISFDIYKGIMRIARIGNDMDRYMRPKVTMCYDYVNKAGIFNC